MREAAPHVHECVHCGERGTLRHVVDYARGMHVVAPYEAPDGWRCRDCGRRLTWYSNDAGRRMLRHHPRGRG